MKILVACRAIDNMAGGVERMSSALMNEMVARGHEVGLFTWDQKDATSFYAHDPKIKWTKLDMGNPFEKAPLSTKFKRFPKIRKAVKEFSPDIIIGFQQAPFISIKIATQGLNIPIIAAERNSPLRLDHMSSGKYRHIIFNSFRLANGITIQCEGHRAGYPAYLHDKMTCIPNPVFPASCQASPANSKTPRILLSVGRLSYQKSPEILVKAFDQIAGDFPDWEFHLAGDGERRALVEETVDKSVHKERIRLLGAQKDTARLYCNSHLFALASRWEGFPNAVAEASAHGLPCVGFAECGGMSDVIKHDATGHLATGNQNVVTLAKSLSALMADDAKRAEMGANAKEAMKEFAPNVIFDQWEHYFESMLKS
ncbi:MAG: hypothetical protein CMH25_03440 [Micavibrio sp.]|nr:hypothetical protein [Micavibrio sp.]|tara:strand:+ start:677038 stop:678144 length:1107 start_codon:yes stop_codon:yes gene_type:complete